jgi:hypothetical protein
LEGSYARGRLSPSSPSTSMGLNIPCTSSYAVSSMSGAWSCSTSIRLGCCTLLVSSPSVRPSSGWSRTWTSSSGSSLGEPCRRGSHPELRRLGALPCRRSRDHQAPTPRTPPVTPIGGGMASGSTLGTQRRRHSHRSPEEGQRGGRAGCGVPPVSRTNWRSSRRSFRSWCSMASMGYGSSTPSFDVESPRWQRGGDRCGHTLSQRIPTARRRRSCRRTKSRVDLTGCCN